MRNALAALGGFLVGIAIVLGILAALGWQWTTLGAW